MVDEVRVYRLRRSVTEGLATLRRVAGAEPSRRADPMWLPGIKYTFVTTIEACVDVAQHFCSSEGWGPPADNGAAMGLPARSDVLASDLAESMRKAVGFRNVLVYEYVDVDDRIVLARLAYLTNLDRFVSAVNSYLQREK